MTENKGLALVTGASSGIGAVYAERLAAGGYDLLLVARRKNRLEEVARRLEEKHRVRAEVLPADLTAVDDLRTVEGRISAAENLTFLLNNAGFGIRGILSESDREQQDEMHRLHIIATMRLTHAAVGGMIARGRGTIVNVSSVAAFTQSPWNTTYGATKAWMNKFTEALAVELKSLGAPIQVQALCPGFTYTEFHDVLGIDRKTVPDAWWMTAEAVVDASLRGLERGRLIVIPGWRYRVFVRGLTLIPGSLRRWLTVLFARRVRRKLSGWAKEGRGGRSRP